MFRFLAERSSIGGGAVTAKNSKTFFHFAFQRASLTTLFICDLFLFTYSVSRSYTRCSAATSTELLPEAVSRPGWEVYAFFARKFRCRCASPYEHACGIWLAAPDTTQSLVFCKHQLLPGISSKPSAIQKPTQEIVPRFQRYLRMVPCAFRTTLTQTTFQC